MIKSLAKELSQVNRITMEAINQHVFVSIQTFVRGPLRDMIIHAVKKKKPVFR